MPVWLEILLLTAATIGGAMIFRTPAELRYSILALGLTVLSLVVPGGRVLTIPFALVLMMIWLFWGARRSAEREEL